jgi:membrane protein DedA with SNARE-associated domain
MVDMVTQAIGRFGYFGVILLMFVETLFPPIPSEVIMPLVGLAAARGEIAMGGAVLAAVTGSTMGAIAWYALARSYGRERLIAFAGHRGRWIGLSPRAVERATDIFARRGGLAVFVGRILPGARVFISVPAGLSRMRFLPFLGFTVAGFVVWYGFLGFVGFAFADRIGSSVLWLGMLLAVLASVPLFKAAMDARSSRRAN